MSYGYTTRLNSLNKQADRTSLGVKLGRVCIKHDMPVAELSSQLGVSRQTIYNWFVGFHEPNNELKAYVEAMISEYK